jgi:sensor histidine kinase YesM
MKRAFAFNDPGYAPFGVQALRGVTPATLGVAVALCLLIALIDAHALLAQWPMAKARFRWWTVDAVLRGWMRTLASAIPLLLLIVWADRRAANASWKRRVGLYVFATVLGSLALAAIQAAYMPLLQWRMPETRLLVGRFFLHLYRTLLSGGLLCAVLFFVARERESAKRLIQSRLARVATERQVAEARLQLLRAQIEPHFLFNSLASVKRLYEADSASGKLMLRNMGRYLHSAVRNGRDRETTLGEEVDMASSFLEIFRERMGERLQTRVEVPDNLRRARVPPLMLATLVENAIKHGLGPRAQGGRVEVTARVVEDRLVIEVADDGVGFTSASGTGVGLANTRARLESLYPGRGDLELRRNEFGGITASLSLPLAFAEPRVESARVVPAADAPATPRTAPDTYIRRFIRLVTWKHWAWAIAIGIVLGLLDRLRGAQSPIDNFSLQVWAFSTAQRVVAAILYVLAIVAVEASLPATRVSAAWRYAAGWIVVSVLMGWAVWEVTPHLPKPPMQSNHPDAAKVARFVSSPRYSTQVEYVFTVSGVLIGHGALGMLLYVWLRNARQTSEALARAELERAEAERKLVASLVAAVEAEVDPAFMFSTLETIENTYDRDRDAADAMLDELIAFLRAAIPKLRSDAAADARLEVRT